MFWCSTNILIQVEVLNFKQLYLGYWSSVKLSYRRNSFTEIVNYSVESSHCKNPHLLSLIMTFISIYLFKINYAVTYEFVSKIQQKFLKNYINALLIAEQIISLHDLMYWFYWRFKSFQTTLYYTSFRKKEIHTKKHSVLKTTGYKGNLFACKTKHWKM